MVDREHELSALLSSAALVMLGGIVSTAANLGERIVIGRLLSPDAYGEVSVGLALLMFTLTVALAGCPQGVSRYIPRYETTADRRGVWISGLLIAASLSAVFGGGMFVFADAIAEQLFETDEAVSFIRLLALAIPFTAGFRIAVAAIRGYENTIYRTVIQNFLDPFVRIALIALLIVAGMGIVAAGAAYLLAAALTLVVSLALLHRLIPLRGQYHTHVRELFTFSLPLVVSSVIGVLLIQTDTLMLGYFRSSLEVGLYNAAYPLATGLTVALSAFGFLYLPIASRLDADGEHDAINDIYATSTKWVYVITFPLFLLLVVFPRDMISLFFGASYTDAAPVLPILAAGFFLSVAAGRDRETLSAVGATTWIAAGNVVGLVVNVGINLALIPRYGFMGAGIASVTSLVTVHAVICGILAMKYDITPFSPEALRSYVALPLILLPLAAVLSSWVTISLLTLLPALIVVGLTSLVVIGLIGGLEPDDVVVIDLLEDNTGVTIPYVRRWMPDDEASGEQADPFLAD
ncbi:flippase [Natronorubrum thiooxidans]|uniref:Membrane protein involved in the export of O-antigen and teichoic acid n=1 Tax=Natronorubrum thiooxidans TaxID=308853 RepID=A0A1N7FJY9_9EURY|nr:flippase [Natronorubrum thiooxidans]SIS00682.1 Membrane protein involved in the export of O-antigen and teichoic acid [Natronorubrum thiooxidans]